MKKLGECSQFLILASSSWAEFITAFASVSTLPSAIFYKFLSLRVKYYHSITEGGVVSGILNNQFIYEPEF